MRNRLNFAKCVFHIHKLVFCAHTKYFCFSFKNSCIFFKYIILYIHCLLYKGVICILVLEVMKN